MTRRRFALAFGALGFLATLPACFLSSVYRDLNRYIPVALLAFGRILDILGEHGVTLGPDLTGAVLRVKASLADIQAALLAWQESHGPTTVQWIRGALILAISCLSDFWQRLNPLPGQLGATVHALLQILISTLTAFEAELPGAGAPAAGSPHAFGYLAAPQLRTVKQFREDFNRVLLESKESKFAI